MDLHEEKVALFIDSENVSYKVIPAIIKEIAPYGRLVLSRFYGDIRVSSVEWQDVALENAIKPVHQYNVATGKNASDIAMSLDAMEVMFEEMASIFVLVTSDSDFTPLAMKLREHGKFVIGIGDGAKATSAYKSSCNVFKLFEYLVPSAEEAKPAAAIPAPANAAEDPKPASPATNALPESIPPIAELEGTIRDVLERNGSGSMLLSLLGNILMKRQSDFDPRRYGKKNLSALILDMPSLKIEEGNKPTAFVKLR